MPAKTHGMTRNEDGTNTKEYKAWAGLKDRCLNPNNQYYHKYGGAGVKVHPEWIKSFESFFAHVGKAPSKDHSIGRLENSLGYIPGNVSWQTQSEQNSNKDHSRSNWKTGPKEAEVILLLGLGWSTRKIAAHVGLGKNSVWLISRKLDEAG